MYFKVNSKEYANFVNHLVELGHGGYDAMLATMHQTAEEGLHTLRSEASKRTQTRTGKLLDSFTMGGSRTVYDVGKNDVVFGSALYYAQMVNDGHAIVPPGYRKDYRKQKRRKRENQRYDYYEGAKFFNPALNKIYKDFHSDMYRTMGLIVRDTSFIRQRKRKKRR